MDEDEVLVNVYMLFRSLFQENNQMLTTATPYCRHDATLAKKGIKKEITCKIK